MKVTEKQPAVFTQVQELQQRAAQQTPAQLAPSQQQLDKQQLAYAAAEAAAQKAKEKKGKSTETQLDDVNNGNFFESPAARYAAETKNAQQYAKKVGEAYKEIEERIREEIKKAGE